MQIQLVIGEQDSRYLNHLLAYLERKHMDKVEIVSFTQPEFLLDYLGKHGADVILIDEAFGIDCSQVKEYGRTACLCDGPSGQKNAEIRYIEKYKKPDLIFKDVLDLYAEAGGRSIVKKGEGEDACRMILVTGFSGGTGSSTLAAAAATALAAEGQKTLYLNLERTGSSGDFFRGPGNYRFDDIIYALKSKRADVGLKMESCVRQDSSGVWFFEPCDTAMYMLELSKEDITRILTELRGSGQYRYVIVDFDFILGRDCLEIMDLMDSIILVNDGTETANTHFWRAWRAMETLEEQMKINLTGRMSLVYNRLSSSRSSCKLQNLKIPVLGDIPPIKHALVKEIIELMLTKKELLSRIR